MATKVYQLYDPKHNQYAVDFPKWTNDGKVWNSESAFIFDLTTWIDHMTYNNKFHTWTPNFQDYQVIETNLQTVTQTKYPLLVYAKDFIDKRTKDCIKYGFNKSKSNHMRSLCGLPLIP